MGCPVGVFLLMRIDNVILTVSLSILLILIFFYITFFSSKIIVKPSVSSGVSVGILAGIMGGIFNIMGPPMVAYYYSSTKNKNEYTTHLQLVFLINTLYLILLHFINGNINADTVWIALPATIAVALGTFVGLYLFKIMKRNVLGNIVALFVLGVALLLLIKSLF